MKEGTTNLRMSIHTFSTNTWPMTTDWLILHDSADPTCTYLCPKQTIKFHTIMSYQHSLYDDDYTTILTGILWYQSNPIFYRPSTACRPGPLKSSKYYQPGHLWPIFISPRTKFSQVQYWYQHCYYQTLTDYPSAAPNYTLNLHRIASCYDDSRQKSTVTSITIGLVNSVGLCLLHCRWDMR